MSGAFEFLKNYEGKVLVNGEQANSETIDKIDNMEEVEIHLIPKSLCEKSVFYIHVRPWMANDSGNLDFHQRWNNGIPMPEREMEGNILAETPGMLKMDLWTLDKSQHWVGFVSKSAIIEIKEK